jgi:Uma2 family endonuclease
MDREADVTVTELHRVHSQLSRFEDMFPGYRVEIVEGNIVMSPVRPFNARTIRLLWNQLEPQLSDEWGIVSDVAMPFSDEFELCPDLAVIPAAEESRNLRAYAPDLVEVVIEVVSPSSVRNDYEVKDKRYAAQGIANYLIFDPTKGRCSTLWNPGADGYLGRDTIPYGKTVTVDTTVGELSFDTDQLPVDPGVSV